MPSTAAPPPSLPPLAVKKRRPRRRVKKTSSSEDESNLQVKAGRPSSLESTSKPEGPRPSPPSAVPLPPPHAGKEKKQRRRRVRKPRLGKDGNEAVEAQVQGSPEKGDLSVKNLKSVSARPRFMKPAHSPPSASPATRSISCPTHVLLPMPVLLVDSITSPPQSSLLFTADLDSVPEEGLYASASQSEVCPRTPPKISRAASHGSTMSSYSESSPSIGAVDRPSLAPGTPPRHYTQSASASRGPSRWNASHRSSMLPFPQDLPGLAPPANSVPTWANGYTLLNYLLAYQMPPYAISPMQKMVPPMLPGASWITGYPHYAPHLPPISARRRSWEKVPAPSYPLEYPPPYTLPVPPPQNFAPMTYGPGLWNGPGYYNPYGHYIPAATGPPPGFINPLPVVPPTTQSTASYDRWSDDTVLDYPGRGRTGHLRKGYSSPDRPAYLDRTDAAYASDMELELGLYECGR